LIHAIYLYAISSSLPAGRRGMASGLRDTRLSGILAAAGLALFADL